MRTQHIVYFLHAKDDDFCKIGESAEGRWLKERIRDYEKFKATRVTLIGYQYCESKEAAKALERKLLDQFDRIGSQDLVRIDPELVNYIQKECVHVESRHLTSLLSVPDYDDFDKEDGLKVQEHIKEVRLAKEEYTKAKRKSDEAFAAMEGAQQAYADSEGKQKRYLEDLAQKLRQKNWEIKKIAEVTGQSEDWVKNVVYKREQTRLVW